MAPRAASQSDARIDYIPARSAKAGRDLVVERAFLADEAVAGVQPSDHYALIADLA